MALDMGPAAFVASTSEDVKSPTTSTFANKIPQFRDNVTKLSESVDDEVEHLWEVRKCLRALSESQKEVHKSEVSLNAALDNLTAFHATEPDALNPVIASGLSKMSVIFRQLNGLFMGLAQCLDNNLAFPLDSVRSGREELRSEAKEVHQNVALYQARLAKLAKHRPKDGGWTTSVTAADMAEDMAMERTRVQQHLCKFYLSLNRQTGRKGSELIENLLSYFRALQTYLMQYATGECEASVAALSVEVERVRGQEDEERRQLREVEALVETTAARLSPRPPSADRATPVPLGPSETTIGGTLWKKSRYGHWQKRDKCRVTNAVLYIPHSDIQQLPMELRLTMCDVRLSKEDPRNFVVYTRADPKRSGHSPREFQAEDETAARRWVSVMKAAQATAFSGSTGNGFSTTSLRGGTDKKALVRRLRGAPGNSACVDCGSTEDVTWVSTNLGVLMCIECAGIHRDLGVQTSRVQSLTLDAVAVPELLVPLSVGNDRLNRLLASKRIAGVARLLPNADKAERKEFIRSKYVNLSFVDPMVGLGPENFLDCVQDPNPTGLVSIFLQKDQKGLFASYPLILHKALGADGADSSLSALGVVELLLVHGASPNAQSSASGSSALHVAAKAAFPRLCRLLLSAKELDSGLRNADGLTAAQVARDSHIAEDIRAAKGLDAAQVLELLGAEDEGRKTALLPYTGDSSSSSLRSADSQAPVHDHQLSSGSTRGPTPPTPSRKPRLRGVGVTERSGSLRTVETPTPPPSHRRSQSESLSRDAVQASSDPMSVSALAERPPLPKPRLVPSPSAPVCGWSAGMQVKGAGSVSCKRCRALFDCSGDRADELSFRKGEIIVVTRSRLQGEDPAWMEGQIQGESTRKGIFPVSFVTFESL